MKFYLKSFDFSMLRVLYSKVSSSGTRSVKTLYSHIYFFNLPVINDNRCSFLDFFNKSGAFRQLKTIFYKWLLY